MSDTIYNGIYIDITPYRESDIPIWASWFNNKLVTRNLEQGRYPVSQDDQLEFARSAQSNNRAIFMIRSKLDELLGTVSLSNIDMFHRRAQVAIVCPPSQTKPHFAALESMALVVQHGFIEFGLNRIYAGQVIDGLQAWILKLVVLGFRVEGVHKNSFFNGTEYEDSISMAITRDNFLEVSRRLGGFWSSDKVFEQEFKKDFSSADSLVGVDAQILQKLKL